MNVAETQYCNKICSMIEDKAAECRLHNFMPRMTNIVSVPDRGVKEYHCIYTFTKEYQDDCLKRNFGFAIDMFNKSIDAIVDEAIKIIKEYHEENKEEIYRK